MLIINILWVDYFITCPMDHSGVVSDQVKYDDFSEKRPSESFSSQGNPSYAWSLVQVLRALHYKFYYIIINNFSDIFFFAKFLHILPLKCLLQFFLWNFNIFQELLQIRKNLKFSWNNSPLAGNRMQNTPDFALLCKDINTKKFPVLAPRTSQEL